MADFPTDLDGLTPAFLSEVLGVEVASVHGALVAAQGAVSTAARLELGYASDGGGPESSGASRQGAVFAKWSSPIEAVRQMAAQNGMYRREVRFYRELAESSDVATPACHFAGWDRKSDEFLLILEDMSASRVGNFYSASLEDVRQVVEALPRFHARWWEHEDLGRLRWLFPLDHPAASGGLQAAFAAALPVTKGRFPSEFGGALGAVAEAIVERYPQIASRYGARPATLAHSDLHLQQVFFPEENRGRFAIFDWQTVGRGFGGQDVARIIGMSLSPAMRRANERKLVELYHRGLVEAGVTAYPFEACWDDYRLGMSWSALLNVVAGASVDQTAMDADAAEHGTSLAETFFGRVDAAIEELDVLSLLG